MKEILESAIEFYNDQEFSDEVMLLTQITHVGKNQLRMMKGYQEMKKSLQAVARLKRLDIVSVLETFNSYVTDEFQSEVCIPHRQNLDYVLIKLQGLAKIITRVVMCTRKSARYFLGLIRNGSFYLKGSIYVSSLAKLWDKAREMCKYTVNFYKMLHPFRISFKTKDNLGWLSEYELPQSLSNWLGDEYDFYIARSSSDSKLLVKPDDIESFRKNICQVPKVFGKFIDEDYQKASTLLPDIPQMEISLKNKTEMDIHDMTVIPRKGIEKLTVEYDHSLSCIKSKESIKLFLKYEEKYRKQDVKKSITFKKVNKKIWKELKDDLKNKLTLMQENSLIEYFHDTIKFYMEMESQ